MGVTLEVEYAVLERAGSAWGRAEEDLDGAGARLAMVSGAGLAPLISAEVDDFAQCWRLEVQELAGLAASARAAIAQVGRDYRVTDRRLAEEIRSLLPWSQRHDRIRES